jgi:hypothetical protein
MFLIYVALVLIIAYNVMSVWQRFSISAAGLTMKSSQAVYCRRVQVCCTGCCWKCYYWKQWISAFLPHAIDMMACHLGLRITGVSYGDNLYMIAIIAHLSNAVAYPCVRCFPLYLSLSVFLLCFVLLYFISSRYFIFYSIVIYFSVFNSILLHSLLLYLPFVYFVPH